MALKESAPPRLEPAVPPDGRRRAPWTRVLALGAGGFALWFLLFAPTLQHNAQVSPVGTRRTVSLDLVGPVATLSRGLLLSHIVSATGREQSLPGGTNGLEVIGPAVHHNRAPTLPARTTGTGPTTTTTTTNPKDPTAAAPLRVLIVGDSLGIDLGDPLQSDLAQTGVVNAALDARESTGLTRPDYFNWPAELTNDVKTYQPQVVVIMMGANDPQDFLGPPDVPYTSSQWNPMYAQRVAQFMQIAESSGAGVYWVGMPPMENPQLNSEMSDINAVDQRQAELAKPAVDFISSTKALGTPQGGYTAFVTDSSGQIIDARDTDGTHLTAGGGQILAQLVINTLRQVGYKIP